MRDETRFSYSKLFCFAVTAELLTLFLSFQILRLIQFSLADFNSFHSCYRFILVVVLLQENNNLLCKYYGVCIGLVL